MKRDARPRNAWIESIKVNTVVREVRNSRTFVIKRRRPIGWPVLVLANIFFRVTRAPIRVLDCAVTWKRWEIDSFNSLHDPPYRCIPEGRCGVAAEQLPGVDLTALLDEGALSDSMARAVGAELRRAHQVECAFFFASGWSHGDPHLGNFIYDAAADRARIIDFEVRHLRSLNEKRRQADDVLVVLQDLLGRSRLAQWLPCARAFVESYGRRDVVAEALEQLAVPAGIARLWWSIRTSWLDGAEAIRRIEAWHADLRVNPLRLAAETEYPPSPMGFAQPPIR